MAHNALIEADWTIITTIDPTAHMAVFDTRQFESINGDQGGTWAPATVVEIGGSGLEVSGPFEASDVDVLTLSGSGVLTCPSGSSIVSSTGATASFYLLNMATNGILTLPTSTTMTGASGSQVNLNHLEMQGATKVSVASRSKTVVQDRLVARFDPSYFEDDGSGDGSIVGATIGTACSIDLHIPHNAVISYVGVLVDHPTHGSSWPPFAVFSFELRRINSSGSTLIAGPWTDSTASVQATYEAMHWADSATGLGITVDRATERYALRCVLETGANALAASRIYAVRVNYTVTEYDED